MVSREGLAVRSQGRGAEFRDKLKVIKKLVEKRSSLHMSTLEDYQQAVDDWLGKMMNILEGEV